MEFHYRPPIKNPHAYGVPRMWPLGIRGRPAFNGYVVRHWNQSHNLNYKRTTEQSEQEHWCETCDRGFYTAQELNNHKLQHQKCNIDGCQFIAHPKVITKHIQMQHSTGLFKKISVLNNPDEIMKWREERKKKYPTKGNIARKAAEISEKINRGEKMGLPKDRKQVNDKKRKLPLKNEDRLQNFKNRRRNSANDYHRKKMTQEENNKVINKNRNNVSKPTEISEFQLNKHTLKPFTGIQNIMMEDGEHEFEEKSENTFDIDDSEWTENISVTQDQKNTMCSSLLNLISNYNTDSDCEAEVLFDHTPEIETGKNIQNINTESEKCANVNTKAVTDNSNVNEISDDSGPEEVHIEKQRQLIGNDETNKVEDIAKTSITKQSRKSNTKFIPSKYHKSKLPSTLLQKLLYNEMRHERNITLQCICYIVSNNYFTQDNDIK